MTTTGRQRVTRTDRDKCAAPKAAPAHPAVAQRNTGGRGRRVYQPAPVDTSGVTLSPGLLALSEHVARNVHENWARRRLADGWRHGPAGDDRNTLHPRHVPYDELPGPETMKDRRPIRGFIPDAMQKKAGEQPVAGFVDRLKSAGFGMVLADGVTPA